ncbi:MAG TPA: terminase small subunit [Agitococcus sp.]|nr:terminase small subunit [Agitococcus sp.]
MTPKQADFVRLYFELGIASEAYKQAYNSTGKPNTLHRKANELLKHPIIKSEIEAMQKEATARNNITIDNVIAELEEARQTAKQSGNASAMVSATLGKAKVLGLDKGEHKEDSPSKAEKIILEVIDARKPQAINLQ